MQVARIIVEKDCLDHPVSRRLRQVALSRSAMAYHEIEPGGSELATLTRGPSSLGQIKSTLVVTKREGFFIDKSGEGSGNPACDFDLEFVWGCPHRCAFCQQLYFTDRRPFIEIFPDLDTILEEVQRVVDSCGRTPVVIEAGGMTDLLALEPYTGILKDMIGFWTARLAGRAQLQFLTKSAEVNSITDLEPGHTVRVGFSVNLPEFAARYALGTASLEQQKEAIKRVLRNGFHLHLSFSPLFFREGVTREYDALVQELRAFLDDCEGFSEKDVTLEALIFFQKRGAARFMWEHFPVLAEELMVRCQNSSAADGGFRYPPEIHGKLALSLKRSFARYFPSARVCFVA